MSFYRTLFVVIAACAIASPVLAENTTTPTTPVAIAAAPLKQAVPATNVKVNVNLAKAKDLLNVKGINPSIARSIVSYRKKHGEFKSLEGLVKVRALSKLDASEFKMIQDQLSL